MLLNLIFLVLFSSCLLSFKSHNRDADLFSLGWLWKGDNPFDILSTRRKLQWT